MLLSALLFGIGLILIIKGGDLFVGAASWIGEVARIPKFMVGATIVSLATTLPELLVSSMAALKGSVEMAVGNAVGSVTVNTGLIMGISLFVCPIAFENLSMQMKALLMLLSGAALAAFSASGSLEFVPCLILLLLLGMFVVENLLSGREADAGAMHTDRPGRGEIAKHVGMFLLGAAGIVWGAQLMVDSGTRLAEKWGISEGIIGVTLMGVGTSLPELATTLCALRRGEAAISVGNIIGANTIDLTLILPACAFLSGQALPIGEQARRLDLPAMTLVLVAAVVPAVLKGRFRRLQGAGMILMYLLYLGILFSGKI